MLSATLDLVSAAYVPRIQSFSKMALANAPMVISLTEPLVRDATSRARHAQRPGSAQLANLDSIKLRTSVLSVS